jgi:predicted nucleic acid-binding protein
MSAEPSEPCFLDTNILVYAMGETGAHKAAIARALVTASVGAGVLRTSTQVLQELYVTLTRKSAFLMAPETALLFVDEIACNPVFVPGYREVREAILLSSRACLSFWDALIFVAAAGSGARRLYSEDLQNGQELMGVTVVNPFLEATPFTNPALQ